MSKTSPPDPPLTPDVADSEWGEVDAQEALDYHAATNTYRAKIGRYSECVPLEVVAAVATVSNTPPSELPPIYEHVDRDAFDALAELATPRAARQETLIVMTYVGYEVTVHGDGILSIRPPLTKSTKR